MDHLEMLIDFLYWLYDNEPWELDLIWELEDEIDEYLYFNYWL